MTDVRVREHHFHEEARAVLDVSTYKVFGWLGDDVRKLGLERRTQAAVYELERREPPT